MARCCGVCWSDGTPDWLRGLQELSGMYPAKESLRPGHQEGLQDRLCQRGTNGLQKRKGMQATDDLSECYRIERKDHL